MSIELTQQTIEILKNFATINSNILLQPGKQLQTMAVANNIVARAKIEEDFGVEFGIWELPSFLAILSSFEEPVLKFSKERHPEDGTAQHVVISEKNGSGRFKYFGSPKTCLHILKREFKMPTPTIEFDITKNVLLRCMKTAAMAQLPNVIIQDSDEGIDLVITDQEIESSNEFRIAVSEEKVDKSFNLIFDTNNFKMLPDSYKVSMDGKVVSRFENVSRGLTYFIAQEKTSSYGN